MLTAIFFLTFLIQPSYRTLSLKFIPVSRELGGRNKYGIVLYSSIYVSKRHPNVSHSFFNDIFFLMLLFEERVNYSK